MLGKSEILLIIVLVVLILFFGAKKIPEIARSVGQSAGEIKKGFSEGVKDDKTETKKTTSETKDA